MPSDTFRARRTADFRRLRRIAGNPVPANSIQPGDAYAMSVDKSTVARIARLARIRVSEDELATLAGELDKIMGWIEQLNEVDTEGVEPMSSSAEGMVLRRREDVVTDGNCRDAVLSNAPAIRDGHFVVPKVVE